jgi:HEAT repeat protein
MNTLPHPNSAGQKARRSPSDVLSLLVELGRVMKASLFYPSGHPTLGAVFQRGFRAFKGEIERNGPLQLEIRAAGFRLPDSDAPIGRGHLDELARELMIRAVRRVEFDEALDPEAFAAFVHVLNMDTEVLEEAGGVERALYQRACGGITVNQIDYQAFLERPDAQEEEKTDSTPFADIGDLVPPESMEELVPDAAEPPPSEADAERPPVLAELLEELEETDDDVGYGQLAARVQELAISLAEGGQRDAGFDAISVFSRHAGDDQKRSAPQREAANSALANLAHGRILADLIRRACDPKAEASIRTAQILLQMGEPVVLPLLEAIRREQEPERRAQMNAILIAMGQKATAPLVEAMGAADSRFAQVATRLAGEIQNPEAVTRISSLLTSDDADLRKEAAKALARIGDTTAVETLVAALDSPISDVPALAAFCLGATGQARAVQPMVRCLRRSISEGHSTLTRELIRSLGRMGRAEAAPELAAILRRRSLFRRRQLRDLQLAAASALGRLPGDVAHSALSGATRSRDPRLRRTAQDALDRRLPKAANT